MTKDQQQAKLAFIGCGSFATSSIFPTIRHLPEIDLVAVCDLDRGKAERNARDFGARHVYSDLTRMLDEQALDGVFVIGPAPQQYELAPHVLRRGIPVYVEKPSANTSAEAIELARLADEHGTWGQVGFMKRFADVYLAAQDIIRRPAFGGLHMIKCRFGQGAYPQLWGIDSPKRSMLIGQLCHIFDLIRFFGGDVKAVQAMYHEVTPTQFAYSVNVQFVNGIIGQLDLNSIEATAAFRDITEVLQLVGVGANVICEDMMSLRWHEAEDFLQPGPQLGRYSHCITPSWTGIRQTDEKFGYRGEVAHFAARCLGRARGGPDLWDSVRSLRIGEAVYEAAESGTTVNVAR